MNKLTYGCSAHGGGSQSRFGLKHILSHVAVTCLIATCMSLEVHAAEPMTSYRQYQTARDANKTKEAVAHLKRALKLWREIHGPDHRDISILLDNLAGLYEDQKKYDEAEKLYKQSLAAKIKVAGPYHTSVADTQNNLAGLYVARLQFPEAQRLYEKSLATYKNKLGPSHIKVADVLRNLGETYRLQGRFNHADGITNSRSLSSKRTKGSKV